MKKRCQSQTSKGKQCLNNISTKSEANKAFCWKHQVSNLPLYNCSSLQKFDVRRYCGLNQNDYTLLCSCEDDDFYNIFDSNINEDYNYNKFTAPRFFREKKEEWLNQTIFADKKINFLFPKLINVKHESKFFGFSKEEFDVVEIGNTIKDVFKALIDWLKIVAEKISKQQINQLFDVRFEGINQMTSTDSGEVFYALHFDLNLPVYTGKYQY